MCLKPFLLADTQSSSAFESILSKTNKDVYKLEVEHGDKLDAKRDYNALEMSFQTVSWSVQVARNYGHLSNFHSIREGMFRQFVQACASINLEGIQKLVCNKCCWAFEALFGGAINRNDAYVDVSLWFCARGNVHNVHCIAIPDQEQHTGQCI